MLEAQQLREVVAGLPLVLERQVSLPDAPLHWLKDSEAVVPTQVLAICSEGCSQRLHIAAAALTQGCTHAMLGMMLPASG